MHSLTGWATLLQLSRLAGNAYASVTDPGVERPLKACTLESLRNTHDISSLRVNSWVDQPNYRGTFDILWLALATIGISTYTMLCLNLPAPKDTYVKLVGRRILWMLLGIIGPEFVLTYAAGQWSRAKWSVYAFRDDHPEWHMRHAFFADMGGFVLHTEDGVTFPLNAIQLHWLVQHEHVDFPKITKREIWDKSKQDTFTKVVTAFQVGYLVIQCSVRAAQKLTITTLELNALAIVVCSLTTSFVWLHKPTDISTPVHIYTTKTVFDMVGNLEWDLTPLDHVDLNGPGYSVNVQPFMGMPVIPKERPIQRIPNDRFPTNPYGVQEYCLCFATLLFTAIHVAGWNFDFPSNVERILWRISALLLFGITVAFWFFETVASWTRLGRWKAIYLYLINRKGLERHRRDVMRRQTLQPVRKMAELPVLWEFVTITPMAIVYGVARLFLIVESFAELRNVNVSAYVNVEWTDFIPHVQYQYQVTRRTSLLFTRTIVQGLPTEVHPEKIESILFQDVFHAGFNPLSTIKELIVACKLDRYRIPRKCLRKYRKCKHTSTDRTYTTRAELEACFSHLLAVPKKAEFYLTVIFIQRNVRLAVLEEAPESFKHVYTTLQEAGASLEVIWRYYGRGIGRRLILRLNDFYDEEIPRDVWRANTRRAWFDVAPQHAWYVNEPSDDLSEKKFVHRMWDKDENEDTTSAEELSNEDNDSDATSDSV